MSLLLKKLAVFFLFADAEFLIHCASKPWERSNLESFEEVILLGNLSLETFHQGFAFSHRQPRVRWLEQSHGVRGPVCSEAPPTTPPQSEATRFRRRRPWNDLGSDESQKLSFFDFK